MKQEALDFGTLLTEADKRDAALDLLEARRAELIAVAKAFAHELVARNGAVTSPQVLALMAARGYGFRLAQVDKRFMGAVFRKGTGWVRQGWSPQGSHKRPVAVWKKE